ncbi:MAG: sialate O-acetylesterase [Algibacter sp.]
MRLTYSIIIILFFINNVSAQTRDVIDLWPNKVPGEIEEKHPAFQIDNISGDVIRLTNITNPSLTVFEPETPNGFGTGIIVCPGGGYSILAIDKEGYEVAEWLNKLGYTAFVLQYRVPKKRKGALQDIQRAIKLVRRKSDLYDLNPQKIGVMGFSAGGHLSALASTSFQTDSYKKEDTIDEFSSRPNFTMLIYPAYLDKGEHKSISPEFNINQQTPPFFIFGTADDQYGNSSLVMTGSLRDKKIPVELHMLAKGGHGYGLRKGNLAAETWPILAENWLNDMMKLRGVEKYQRTINFPKVEVKPKTIPKKKEVWAFIMAGQSNMAGRGFVEPKDTISSERILTINKNNELIQAKAPLNIYEPKMSGLDCGMSFANKLLKNIPDHVSILLIPTAVGGSAMHQWIGDSIHRDVKLLSNFKEKVTFAKKYGKIKGILWHQGESDTRESRRSIYEKNMSQLFKIFRSSVRNKKLPILVGELGSYSKNKASWAGINNAINNYALKDKQTFVISTSDLKDRGDSVHFNSESQRIMGKRFADAFIENINP